jgi:hypothetical protein
MTLFLRCPPAYGEKKDVAGTCVHAVRNRHWLMSCDLWRLVRGVAKHEVAVVAATTEAPRCLNPTSGTRPTRGNGHEAATG